LTDTPIKVKTEYKKKENIEKCKNIQNSKFRTIEKFIESSVYKKNESDKIAPSCRIS
jgi:hypothetical protein